MEGLFIVKLFVGSLLEFLYKWNQGTRGDLSHLCAHILITKRNYQIAELAHIHA